MKEIMIKDKKMLVDDNDFESINKYKWHISLKGYAIRKTSIDRKNINYSVHRIIVNAPKGMTVDHINGNKLDNRKENLRICTNQQNCWNRGGGRGSSKYTGVHLFNYLTRCTKQPRSTWRATISVNGKYISLGCFDTEERAALAYNTAATKYFGEYARLNEICS